MNYGLYLSASGTLNALYRMDVAANNLANSETTGFKPDITAAMARDAANPEDGLHLPSNKLLEKLGGGVLAGPNRTAWRQGALQTTNNDLDVGIQGDGFLRIRSTDGSRQGLTRDGRLSLNTRGQLVQASTGLPVLSDTNRPITIQSGRPIAISSSGVISQDGLPVARLAFVDVPDQQALRKRGDGFLELPPDTRTTPAEGSIVQHTIERSSVDPVRAMLDIAQAERSAGSGSRMIQIHDEVMQKAINTFARLA